MRKFILVLMSATFALFARAGLVELGAASVPPLFDGDNLTEVVRAFDSVDALKPKDEFETTAQYEARVEKARGADLGGRNIGDPLIVRLDIKKLDVAYDADAGVLNIRGPSPRAWDYRERAVNHRHEILVSSSRRFVRSYEGSNAFGKQMMVAVYDRNDTSLVFDSYVDFLFFKESLALPPERARDLKQNLRIFVVGVPASPFVLRKTDHTVPTTESPEELIINTTGVFIDFREIWLVNGRTGEIVLRPQLRVM